MLTRFEDEDGFVGYRSPLLGECALPHLFTTRLGGVDGEALDFRIRTPAQCERVALAAGLEGARFATVSQVHGADVVRVGSGELPERSEKADGLVSERSDVLVGVFAADCVPVLIARRDGSGVAAVHAGWRGLVAGVIPGALELLGPGALVAAVGPCLSLQHFEIGPEVVAAFERAGLGDAVLQREGMRAHIDLRGAAAHQLAAGGVTAIDTSDRCTWEHAGDFFSYRREITHGSKRHTGSLGAVIAAAPAG